jgi:F-type H+-transporting ATPase subunit epsilon
MREGIALKIVTPEGVRLDRNVFELTAPSVNGQFGVLPGHRPLLAALRTGIVSYVSGGETQFLAVGPGFVEVSDDKAVLLTQRFVSKADVDPVVARRSLKEAEEALQKADTDDTERALLIQKSLWAATQLELYGDPPPATIHVAHELAHLGYSKLKAEQAAAAADAPQGDSD